MSPTHRIVLLAVLLFSYGCGPKVLYSKAEGAREIGDLSRSLADAERGFQRYKPGDPWHWRFKLLLAELVYGRDRERSRELLKDEIPIGVPEHDYLAARLVAVRGFIELAAGNPQRAEELLNRARDQASRSAPDILPEILMRQATILIGRRNFAEAENSTREAIELARKSGDRYNEANALGQLGYFLQSSSRFDEAISMFGRSFAISKTAGYEIVSETSALNTGWCYFRLGDLDRAAGYYREAQTSNRRTGNQRIARSLYNNLGSLHWQQGEIREAIEAYRQASEISERLRDPLWTAKILDNLATVMIEDGDLEGAARLVDRALQLKSQDADVNNRVWPLLASGEISYLRQQYPAAQSSYQTILKDATEPELLWAAHAGLARTYAGEGDTGAARAEYARAIGVIDASWTRLLNDASKITFHTGVVRFYQQYVDFLMSRGLEQEALEFAESRRARLLAQGMDQGTASPSFSETAKRLDAVLLSYWVSPTKSYLWMVGPDKMRSVTLPSEPKLRGLATRYQKAINANRVSLIADATGRELYDTLVAPAAGFLKPNARVVLVPDGILHSLNFETLPTPSGHYWLEDAIIEIAPSLHLIGQEERAPRQASESILLIGDPIYTDPALPPLPHAAEEIRGIAQLFPKPLALTGAAAKPAAYRQSSPVRFGMIHFAAHALGNSESPLDSAVALSPGPDTYKLYAREVQLTPLVADLVTISACRSAGERTFSGEGLVGFAWAFLRAGARNVIASLWDVNDSSTAAFMKSLYTKVREGQRPADALRAVKLEFLRGGPWQKPYYWAPFQVYAR